MSALLSTDSLPQENCQYRGTGGVSSENRAHRFIPAFCDLATGRAYISRFADGSLAPVHVLDGLPEPLIEERTPAGTVKAAAATVMAGFVRQGRFYTREQAAAVLGQISQFSNVTSPR